MDTEDLVDAQIVADILSLSHRNSVSLYQRRYDDMPRPIVDLGDGRVKLWLRPEIERWAEAQAAGGRTETSSPRGSLTLRCSSVAPWPALTRGGDSAVLLLFVRVPSTSVHPLPIGDGPEGRRQIGSNPPKRRLKRRCVSRTTARAVALANRPDEALDRALGIGSVEVAGTSRLWVLVAICRADAAANAIVPYASRPARPAIRARNCARRAGRLQATAFVALRSSRCGAGATASRSRAIVGSTGAVRAKRSSALTTPRSERGQSRWTRSCCWMTPER